MLMRQRKSADERDWLMRATASGAFLPLSARFAASIADRIHSASASRSSSSASGRCKRQLNRFDRAIRAAPGVGEGFAASGDKAAAVMRIGFEKHHARRVNQQHHQAVIKQRGAAKHAADGEAPSGAI